MQKSYLKDRQEYSDQYDRYTVDICRRMENIFNNTNTEIPKKSKISKRQAKGINRGVLQLRLYFEKGERYLNKNKTIQEWIDRDTRKDKLYESAQPPDNARCLNCRNKLIPFFKELISYLDKEDRILFMFKCPNKCLPNRAFYSDGEEWRSKLDLCPHCDKPLKLDMKDDGKVNTTTYSCSKCKYKRSEDYVWKHQEDNIDPDFAMDRDRFCLNEEQGLEYMDAKYRLNGIVEIVKEQKEIDKQREEKLKEHPEGFAIEKHGSCNLCKQSTFEKEDYWYDKWGIKCLVCQKAIDKKEIPGSLLKFKDSWYSSFDLENRFEIKSPTIRKWIRDGILKPRIISHYGKGNHAELFLIKDNKDFLPPKKLTESRGVNYEKEGKTWFTTEKWYKYTDLRKKVEKYKIMNYLKVVEKKDLEKEEN